MLYQVQATGAWAMLFTELGGFPQVIDPSTPKSAGLPTQSVWVALSLGCVVSVLRQKQLVRRGLKAPQAFLHDFSVGGGFTYQPLIHDNRRVPIWEDRPASWEKWWADMSMEVQVQLM